ncbi:cytochrome c3 family protein [Candidatus Aerophobetes bacterium]|nr:cytochrome c3 family protein [Candidatus Aerophobetes bacterium]
MRKLRFFQTLSLILVLGILVVVARSEFHRANSQEQTSSSADMERCLVCHSSLKSKVDVQKIKFDHTPFIERQMNCSSCHEGIVRGKGEVFSDSCFTCHASAKFLKEISRIEYMHQIHVTERKINCSFCHERIIHPAK